MALEYVAAYYSYLDYLDQLSDAECGRLFKAMLTYGMTGETPELRGNERFVFPGIKSQIDRDAEKYKARCNKNRESSCCRTAPRGSKHWNWKGGITPINQVGRNSTDAKEWRMSVFARDNYTCKICGARGVKLNAHHIKHWADNPDLRYDVDNGVTLCEKCHKEIHRRGC